MTDYPAPVVLANLRMNVQNAVPSHLESKYRIEGHEWGDIGSPNGVAADWAHQASIIIAADCYWMPDQHLSLVQSMLHFMTLGPSGRIFAIAGFHTGRAKLAAFFDVAVEEGLDVEEIYEEDADGNRRVWQKERDGGREDHTERKKWLVIARLKRKVS